MYLAVVLLSSSVASHTCTFRTVLKKVSISLKRASSLATLSFGGQGGPYATATSFSSNTNSVASDFLNRVTSTTAETSITEKPI